MMPEERAEEMRLDLIWCAVTFDAIADTLRHHSQTHYRWCEGLARESSERLRRWSAADPNAPANTASSSQCTCGKLDCFTCFPLGKPLPIERFQK